MAIYERDTILNLFEEQTYPTYKTNIKITSSEINSACEYELDMSNFSTSFTTDDDGGFTLLEDVEVVCKYNQGTLILPTGTKIYKNINNGLITQSSKNRVAESNGWVRDTNSYTVKVFGNPSYNIAIVSSKVNYSPSDTRRPKLSEWHIYGNEQQGRFSKLVSPSPFQSFKETLK